MGFLAKTIFIILPQTRGTSRISNGLSPGQQRIQIRSTVIECKQQQSSKLTENKIHTILWCVTSGQSRKHRKILYRNFKLWVHVYRYDPSNENFLLYLNKSYTQRSRSGIGHVSSHHSCYEELLGK